MKQDKEYMPQDISDRITQDLIDKLLRDVTYKKEHKKFSPYDLTGERSLNLEAGFKHGVKPAPPATKELKPAAESMFEYEILRSVGDDIETPEVIYNTYTKINIPRIVGDYYIRISLLRNLMSRFIYEDKIRSCRGGHALVAKLYIDTKLLRENCIRRKKVSY